jgi:ABC-2 type transport system ATP-binding protein
MTEQTIIAPVIRARGLSKSFGSFQAVKNLNFTVPLGRIVGLIGANGAGKTTLLNAILGLTSYGGELSVFGIDPSKRRNDLMKEVCFISDVATLPKWMRVADILDFVGSVHPKFDRAKAENALSQTKIRKESKIRTLSKGMVVQLHLAIVMAIDAKLLVLDEPTLGLDILFRKQFYQNLLEEYFDETRTIIITTHQVEEIENILTDVIFIKDGEIVLQGGMEEITQEFQEVLVAPGMEEKARALHPISTGTSFGKTTCVYQGVSPKKLANLGEIRHLGLADIFVATMTGEPQ